MAKTLLFFFMAVMVDLAFAENRALFSFPSLHIKPAHSKSGKTLDKLAEDW